MKLDLAGGNPTPIPMELGKLRLAQQMTSTAVAPDGRIVIQADSPDSFFESAAIVDPRTGRVEKITTAFSGDIHSPGWTKDGRIVALAVALRSSLWRFRPAK